MVLQGKIAIVTGASAGIGRAYALALAGAGTRVIALARRLGDSDIEQPNAPSLRTLVNDSRGLSGAIEAYACDVSVESELVDLVQAVTTNHGRVDVLVNNAAFMARADPFDLKAEQWDRYMAVNVRAPYVAIREVAPVMIRQKSGSIINITAGAAGMDPKNNYPGTLPYAVSKAALNRLTQFMAAEFRPHGVAVNALSPGVVLSESALKANPDAAKAGTHKPCTPDILGPALLWLATQTAGSCTGRILHTDEFGKSWP